MDTNEPSKYVRASKAVSEQLQPFVDDIREMFLEKKLIGSRISREIEVGDTRALNLLCTAIYPRSRKNLLEKACMRFEAKPKS